MLYFTQVTVYSSIMRASMWLTQCMVTTCICSICSVYKRLNCFFYYVHNLFYCIKIQNIYICILCYYNECALFFYAHNLYYILKKIINNKHSNWFCKFFIFNFFSFHSNCYLIVSLQHRSNSNLEFHSIIVKYRSLWYIYRSLSIGTCILISV